MKKRFSLVLLAAALLLSLMVPAGLASETAPATDARLLWSLGLAKGVNNSAEYSDDNMALDRQATRAEAVIMLVRLLGQEETALAANAPHGFSDVPDWAAPYIGYAVREGISNGVGNGRFGSNDPITLRDFTTLVLRALGYQDLAGDFSWDSSKAKAVELGLYSQDFSSRDNSTRGALFTVSTAALVQTLKGSDQTLAGRLAQQGVLSSSCLVNGVVTAADRATLLSYQDTLGLSGEYEPNLSLLADVTGDGVAELFLLSKDDFFWSVYIFSVVNGTVQNLNFLYTDYTNSGGSSYYLCNVDGQNYILELNSYLISGTDGMEANIAELYRFDANGSRVTLESDCSDARIAQLTQNATLLLRCDGIMKFSSFQGNALADAVAHAPVPQTPAPAPSAAIELAPYLGLSDQNTTLAFCQVMGLPATAANNSYDLTNQLSQLDGFTCSMEYGSLDFFTITSDAYSVEGVKVGMSLDQAKAQLASVGASFLDSSDNRVFYILPNTRGILNDSEANFFTINLTLEYDSTGTVTTVYYFLYADDSDGI